jgi:hypothetical protein
VFQEHDYGCGIASLAMVSGDAYGDVHAWLLANVKNTQSAAWLTERGIHHGIVEFYLAQHGFVWRTVYEGWGLDVWPPAPFAPIHVCSVVQPSRNQHFVVMLDDGRVLDPLDGTLGLALMNWPKVNNVVGIWRLSDAE